MPKELKNIDQMIGVFNKTKGREAEATADITLEAENLAENVSDLLSSTSEIAKERFIRKQNTMMLDAGYTFTKDKLRELCVIDAEAQTMALKRAVAKTLITTETPTNWDFVTITTSQIVQGLLDANDKMYFAYENAIKAHDGEDQQELALLHAHRDMYKIACVSLAHADALIEQQCMSYKTRMDAAKVQLEKEMKNATVN